MTKLAKNQLLVLERMMRTVGPDSHMTIPQFADMATCSKLREEWATSPLKALERLNLFERSPAVLGHKTIRWRITTEGVEAVMEHRRAAA